MNSVRIGGELRAKMGSVPRKFTEVAEYRLSSGRTQDLALEHVENVEILQNVPSLNTDTHQP